MSDNFISNVLNILRLVRSTNLPGHATLQYITTWADTDLSEPAALRICAYVQDQCDGALQLIAQSKLADEAKGLSQTVQSLRAGFAVSNLSTALLSHLPQLDAAISSFAILESVSNLGSDPVDRSELEALIQDVEEVMVLFNDADLDPIVASTGRKHLHVLLTLLKNVEALGVDAAMAAYAELVVRLRRVDATASAETRAKVGKAWESIEKWGGRLTSVDKAMNSGQSLLEQAQGLGRMLLSHLP